MGKSVAVTDNDNTVVVDTPDVFNLDTPIFVSSDVAVNVILRVVGPVPSVCVELNKSSIILKIKLPKPDPDPVSEKERSTVY